MKTINVFIFFVSLVLISGCGDDDGGSPTTTLEGEWSDLSVPIGSADDALIVVNFEGSTGTVTAATDNNQNTRCGDLLFRDITSTDEVSFQGEGFVDLGSGADWFPVLFTINSIGELELEYMCGGCDVGLDVLQEIDPANPVIPVVIDSDIENARTLVKVTCDPDQPDYLITEFIEVEDILTIEPGVTIAFGANAGLIIDQFQGGTIIAKGTSSDLITFTGATKTKGFWRGIKIESNDVRNEMDYVIIEYAGSDELADDINGGVNGALSLDYEPGGFIGSLKLTNSIIRNNDGYGLIIERFSLLRSFANNVFEDNTNAAALMEAPSVGDLDEASNFTGGNGYEGVEIAGTTSGNEVVEDAIWPAFTDGSSYLVSESIEVNAMLTIMPGAVFEFEANQEFYFEIDQFGSADGIIVANGTTADPITFSGVSKTPGYWKGIRITSNSNLNEMDYCIVEYGGSDPIAGSQAGNIGLDKNGAFDAPKLILKNSTIRNSSGCGIVVESGESTFTESGNIYESNPSGNVCN